MEQARGLTDHLVGGQGPGQAARSFSDGVADALAAVDAEGWVHAVDLDRGTQVGYRSDEMVVLASVFKIPVLIELFRRFGEGRLDPRERVEVAVEGRSDGPTGLSVMADPIEPSLRDLAYWMMSVSDNAATDVLVNHLGTDSINATIRALGLSRTRVDGTCGDLYKTMAADVPQADETTDVDIDRLRAARAVDPERRLHAGAAVEIVGGKEEEVIAALWPTTRTQPAAAMGVA